MTLLATHPTAASACSAGSSVNVIRRVTSKVSTPLSTSDTSSASFSASLRTNTTTEVTPRSNTYQVLGGVRGLRAWAITGG